MPRIAVVDSVNLDLVARVHRLPAPGESPAAGDLRRANQALAARRPGAEVNLVAAVGDDAAGDEAPALLRDDGVGLEGLRREPGRSTGHALVIVDDSGDTMILAAAGANATLEVGPADVRGAAGVLTVLGVPDPAVAAAAEQASGLVVLDATPARALPDELLRQVDLVVVNTAEDAAIDGPDAAGALAATRAGAQPSLPTAVEPAAVR